MINHRKKLKDYTFTTNYIFFDYEGKQNTGTQIPYMVAHDFEDEKYMFFSDKEAWLMINFVNGH